MKRESRIEVLVATMHQKDFSIIDRMNLNCDAFFANQADEESIVYKTIGGHCYKMVTTKTRGVGKNRNIALIHAVGDILLFSDDDIIYNSDMSEKVLEAFNVYPKADAIVFGISFTLNGEIYKTRCPKSGKLPVTKSLKYGVAVIAIKKEKLLLHHLNFTELFGGGCIYSHGEDSEFIISCYRHGLRVYSYNYVLGVTAKDTSTCFNGYNEKYFYDTGALAKSAFGIFAIPYICYMSIRLRKKQTLLSIQQGFKYMIAGYSNYKKMISYDEWVRNYES